MEGARYRRDTVGHGHDSTVEHGHDCGVTLACRRPRPLATATSPGLPPISRCSVVHQSPVCHTGAAACAPIRTAHRSPSANSIRLTRSVKTSRRVSRGKCSFELHLDAILLHSDVHRSRRPCCSPSGPLQRRCEAPGRSGEIEAGQRECRICSAAAPPIRRNRLGTCLARDRLPQSACRWCLMCGGRSLDSCCCSRPWPPSDSRAVWKRSPRELEYSLVE